MRKRARAGATAKPGGTARREQNKLEKFERIRRAAYALFLERGVNGTSLSEVAQRAEVAKGTLFLYARDKSDLVCLVMHDRIARAVDDQLATLPRSEPLLAQLLHVFRGLFEMYGHHPELSRSFIASFPGAKGQNATRLHGLTFSFLATLTELLRAAQERNEVALDLPLAQCASNLFSLYFGALMVWLSDLSTLEGAFDTVLRQALVLQIRGFAPRPQEPDDTTPRPLLP